MPIRRAGQFEAPGAINSVTNPGGGVADTSAMWDALGQAADNIGRKLGPALDQVAEAQARQDFAAGNLHQRNVLLHQDEAYNNAMQQLYAAQASMDIDTAVDELENAHPLDAPIDQFDDAVVSARNAFIAEAPPAFAMQAGALFDRAHLSSRQRLGERQRTFATERLQQQGVARLTQMEGRLSGFTDLELGQFAEQWSEYEATGGALSANPLSGIFPDEWELRRNHTLSRITANSYQYTAERMYEDGGSNAESADAALAFLETAANAPKLVLDEGERDSFFGEGRRRIMGLERERLRGLRELNADIRAARIEAGNNARDTMVEVRARGAAFSIVSPDEIEALRQSVVDSNNPGLARQFNTLVIENNYRRNVHGMSVTEVEQFNDTLQAIVTEGGERAGEAAIALEAGRVYVDHIRRGDPLIVGQQHLGQAPPPILDGNGHVDADGLGPRIRHAESTAEELGAAQPSYLSPGERQAIRSAVNAGGEEALQIVRTLVGSAYGADGDGFVRAQRILHEVAPDHETDAALLAAGSVLIVGGDSSRETARLILEAQRLRQVEGYVRPQLPGQNEADSRETLINNTLGGRGAFLTPMQRAELRRSADLVFEGMIAGGGEAANTTYSAAVRASLGSVMRSVNGAAERFGGVATGRPGENVVVPNWMRTDQWGIIRHTLGLEDYSAANNGRVPRNGVLADWRNAYWIPTEDGAPGRYHLAENPDGTGHFESEVGVPYVLDLNLIRERLAAARPDAIVR